MDLSELSEENEFDDDDEEDSVVSLHVGDRVIETASWRDCVEDQDDDWLPALASETFQSLVQVDDVVAFYDRNFLDARWRKCLVYRGEAAIHLFDVDGTPIDESDTPNGVQSFENFEKDFDGGYYKVARAAPPRSSSDAPNVASNDDDNDDERDDDITADDEVAASQHFDSVIKVGKRIKHAIGRPAKWYGGFVAGVKHDAFMLAYDDGDIKLHDRAWLAERVAAKTIITASEEERGVIANQTGFGMAERITYVTLGKASDKKVAGVLVGDTKYTLGAADHKIYEMHSIRPEAFQKEAGGSKSTRATKVDATKELQVSP